jgi:hypothetical protein
LRAASLGALCQLVRYTARAQPSDLWCSFACEYAQISLPCENHAQFCVQHRTMCRLVCRPDVPCAAPLFVITMRDNAWLCVVYRATLSICLPISRSCFLLVPAPFSHCSAISRILCLNLLFETRRDGGHKLFQQIALFLFATRKKQKKTASAIAVSSSGHTTCLRIHEHSPCYSCGSPASSTLGPRRLHWLPGKSSLQAHIHCWFNRSALPGVCRSFTQ